MPGSVRCSSALCLFHSFIMMLFFICSFNANISEFNRRPGPETPVLSVLQVWTYWGQFPHRATRLCPWGSYQVIFWNIQRSQQKDELVLCGLEDGNDLVRLNNKLTSVLYHRLTGLLGFFILFWGGPWKRRTWLVDICIFQYSGDPSADCLFVN